MRVAPSPLLKRELRRALRAERRALPPDRRRAAALAVGRLVAASKYFRHGRRVGIYLPFDAELDTAELVAIGRRRGIVLLAPLIRDRHTRRMCYAPLTARLRRRHTMALTEPVSQRGTIDIRWLDLVLVPVVAVDAKGYRLGMGGGFFDRALQFRKLRQSWRGPRLLGLGFEMQRVAELPREPWDVRLDAMTTESGTHCCRGDTQ